MRPSDDAQVPTIDALRWHEQFVADAGAPTAALIIGAVASDLEAGGALSASIPAVSRFGDLPALRVMAVLHRLALERAAPAVAVHLPTLGGTPPATSAQVSAFARAVVSALADHPDQVSNGITRTPQTNETGRAALLRIALAREGADRPVRLREIGASAGLNLRADHLPGVEELESGPLPVVVDRVGCDLDPIDASTAAGRTLLSSYVWVDDVERFARLGHALDIAARVPATVLRMDAEEFCRGLHVMAGTTTVLWHSAMWLYLPPTTKAVIRAAITDASASAAPSAPLLHVSWEWDAVDDAPSAFSLVARRWDGVRDRGEPRVLVRGMSHGHHLVAVPSAPVLEVDPLVRG